MFIIVTVLFDAASVQWKVAADLVTLIRYSVADEK